MSYEPSTPTGQVITGTPYSYTSSSGYLKGVVLVAGASAPATVTVYDTNTGSATGTVLANYSVLQGTSFGNDYGPGMVFNKGLYIVVTGTGGTATAYFVPGQ